ncbi:MAG: hypothetical protein M1827_000982 [Pycnora praestabilis]|nr:MAG: hypothetical protein M1827_000982 [Pycnora praestabilis]
MDPKVVKAKQRHQSPKVPSTTKSALAQKLEKNPYALAIDTPVRFCGITGARLPQHFLIKFGLKAHPKTGMPWYLPEDLAPTRVSPYLSRVKRGLQLHEPESPKSESHNVEPEWLDIQNEAETDSLHTDRAAVPYEDAEFMSSSTKETPSPHSPSLPSAQSRLPFSSVLAQSSVLNYMGKGKKWSRMTPQRIRENRAIKEQDIVWREDMETLVTKLLRKKVVEELTYLYTRNGGSQYLIWLGHNQGVEEVIIKRRPGCVILLEPNSPFLGKMDRLITKQEGAKVPDFVTVKDMERQIPVYDLPTMLGEEHMRSLRVSGADKFQVPTSIIRSRRTTMPVLMWLWKLRGFLGDYRKA